MTGTQQQLKEMRTLIQELGWEEFMAHVGSLMAEQAFKVSGEQSDALFNCSRTVHALHSQWAVCGKFQYPSDMVNR